MTETDLWSSYIDSLYAARAAWTAYTTAEREQRAAAWAVWNERETAKVAAFDAYVAAEMGVSPSGESMEKTHGMD